MAPGESVPMPPGGPPPGPPVEEGLEQWTRNPLLCWLCDELYEEPCLLSCYHSFCSRCLKPRVHDSKIVCPLCGKVSQLKDGILPPRDNLMVFLVESSCEERPQCANCDKINQTAMFFCNTCGQTLCGHCRDETHRARMFALHDIIHISKRGREVNRKCAMHGEPHIMFSTTKRTMLCINCFRESSLEARLHCIDLDTAYTQGCKKLERAVMLPGETLLDIDTAYTQARQRLDRAAMSIMELQKSVRDGVYLFKALLEELKRNMETEKNNINTLSDALQDAVRRTQDLLLREVDGQYESKDKLFRAQLSSLGALLPIIQVHLLMCTTFSSSASKYEFLDLVFLLMERLAAIAHLSHPLRPGQSSQIRSNFKSEYARSLEPLLSVVARHREATALASGSSGCSGKQSSDEGCASRPTSAASMMGGAPAFGMSGNRRSLSAAKLKIIESGGQFAEHCKQHENKFRELSSKFTRLKEEAQELHRDVTMRRCLTRRGRVEEIVRECAALEDEFKQYTDDIEDQRVRFDNNWDEMIQRVYAEQEVFTAQVNDVVSLRDENKRLMIIAQQLEPYIRSITALMERISPKLQAPAEQTQAMTASQVDIADNVNMNTVLGQILDQISKCNKDDQEQQMQPQQTQQQTQQPQRSEGRGCGDGASRQSGPIDDSVVGVGGQIASNSVLHLQGIPRPPDPPSQRRTPDQDDEQDSDPQHSFSPGPGSIRGEGALTSSMERQMAGPASPTSSMSSTLASSASHLGGSYIEVSRADKSGRRKRQNSEGDSLLWEKHRGCESETEMVSSTSSLRLHQRRNSEGSEVGTKKGVFMQFLDKVRFREDKKNREYESDAEDKSSSKEQVSTVERVVYRVPKKSNHNYHPDYRHTEHFIDLAAQVFDASVVPERPKSACDNNTLLRAAEKLYGLGTIRSVSGGTETQRTTDRFASEAQSRRSSEGKHSSECSQYDSKQTSSERVGIKSRPSSTERVGSHSRNHSAERTGSHSRQHSAERTGTHSRQHSAERTGTHSRQHSAERTGTHSRQHSAERSSTATRHTYECLDEAQARALLAAVRSRENSLGRPRSTERDREGVGMRTPKVVSLPKVTYGRGGEFSVGEVKAMVHAEPIGGTLRKSPGRKDIEAIYAVAATTLPRKISTKKENIYENVLVLADAGGHYIARGDDSYRQRPMFKKQNSLDALPAKTREGGAIRKGESMIGGDGGISSAMGDMRRGTLRKADSFEGHEEAVKTLVAAVQETRILRRKKTK